MHVKKLSLLPALALGVALLANCSPKTGKSTASSSSATKPEPHYTTEQIAQGQTIYSANCAKCHKLVNPADKSVSKWNSVLPSMIKKAHLSDEQGALVRAYVMANVKS